MSKRRGPQVIIERGRLVPAGPLDVEDLDALPDGARFELVSVSRRSRRQDGMYWLALHRVVAASHLWHDAEELHDALQRDLGHVSVHRNLDGSPYLVAAGTGAMKQAEFGAYLDRAIRRLAEVIGRDPLAFIETKRAA